MKTVARLVLAAFVAVALGGEARAEKVTKKQRSEIAKTAAAARWKN